MAKSHSGGPGSYRSGGVNCTMDAPFKTKGGKPESHMTGAFAGGVSGGELPTTVTANLGRTSRQTPGQVAPSQQGQKRSGTKEYPMGGGNMRDGKSSGRP